MPEELTLDYAEITSIPPLPLWTLLAADKEESGPKKQQNDDVKVKTNKKALISKNIYLTLFLGLQ